MSKDNLDRLAEIVTELTESYGKSPGSDIDDLVDLAPYLIAVAKAAREMPDPIAEHGPYAYVLVQDLRDLHATLAALDGKFTEVLDEVASE